MADQRAGDIKALFAGMGAALVESMYQAMLDRMRAGQTPDPGLPESRLPPTSAAALFAYRQGWVKKWQDVKVVTDAVAAGARSPAAVAEAAKKAGLWGGVSPGRADPPDAPQANTTRADAQAPEPPPPAPTVPGGTVEPEPTPPPRVQPPEAPPASPARQDVRMPESPAPAPPAAPAGSPPGQPPSPVTRLRELIDTYQQNPKNLGRRLAADPGLTAGIRPTQLRGMLPAEAHAQLPEGRSATVEEPAAPGRGEYALGLPSSDIGAEDKQQWGFWEKAIGLDRESGRRRREFGTGDDSAPTTPSGFWDRMAGGGGGGSNDTELIRSLDALKTAVETLTEKISHAGGSEMQTPKGGAAYEPLK